MKGIKEKIRQTYSKIAIDGNNENCCMPGSVCCNTDSSSIQALLTVGYDKKDLESLPQSSILGVGCGAPLKFADLKEGETVVDLGSGAGIDAFLASRQVLDVGKVIGIDFTEDMLKKAATAAKENGYTNVEFRKGDIENKIPIEDHSVEVVISNCVINLTCDKVKTFKEVYRILKGGEEGRIAISDLITDKEVRGDDVNPDKWCSCIDGALTKQNYINSIKEAGFQNVKILSEQVYMNETKINGRKITSIVVGAVTGI
jgi:SAM-dependent methyltransferase